MRKLKTVTPAMFHGTPQPHGRLLLGPSGPTPLLNDSGAQVSIVGAEFEGILVELQQAPANMRIFGTCNNPLDMNSKRSALVTTIS